MYVDGEAWASVVVPVALLGPGSLTRPLALVFSFSSSR
jgi:hypothetical protein